MDVGGTFTDFVLWRGDTRIIHKILSTHPNPEYGVLQGLCDLGVIDAGPDSDRAKAAAHDPGAGEAARSSGAPVVAVDIIHGSTIATNAILERKGARVALITTEGFTDLIDIGRQNRPHLYRLWAGIPAPLVPRERRYGMAERIGAGGEVVRVLKEGELDTVVDWLREVGADAVAVCFLFSFLNPSHERSVEDRLVKEGYFVSPSYKILPEYREFERLSTTVINAFVTPLIAQYLRRLAQRIGAGADNLHIMQSNGGLISAEGAARRAVTTVLSGPAGGAVAALQLGRETGTSRLISFDMGGTSTDVSLIDGDIALTTEFSIDSTPVKVPMVDIHTVGAGGGSIAWVDAGGAIQVGPQSAGSDPGPACYGRGEEPTVTDANVLLGRLHPEHFLGGRQRLDVERAERALGVLAEQSALSATTAADGVIKIAISNMEKAIRKISVERGYDPRDFTLVAFGGAGPMHACELAEAALIPRVLVPTTPGVFSALGMTVSDVIKDYSQSVLKKQAELSEDDLQAVFAPLLDKATADLAAEGFTGASVRLDKALDLRYTGQSFELTVRIDEYGDDYAEAFHAGHKERYGYASPGEEIEVVGVRLRAVGLRVKPRHESAKRATAPAEAGMTTRIFFGGWHDAPCYERHDLLAGHTIHGPALVFQLDTTIVIPPDWWGEVDARGNLLLQRSDI